MLNNLDRKSKISILIAIIIVVIAVPLTIIQVQKQQNLRQRAEGASLQLFSLLNNINNGDSFNADILLKNTGGKDISAFDVTLTTEDVKILELVSFTPKSGFSIVNSTISPNKIHAVAVNISTNPISDNANGDGIVLGTLTLRGVSAGETYVDFSSEVKITTPSIIGVLPVDTTNKEKYTIVPSSSIPQATTTVSTPTDTILPVVTPTITSAPTVMPTSAPISTIIPAQPTDSCDNAVYDSSNPRSSTVLNCSDNECLAEIKFYTEGPRRGQIKEVVCWSQK